MSPPTPAPADDVSRDEPRDEHLRAALRHAPDADLQPPPHLRAQIVAAAHRALGETPPAQADSAATTAAKAASRRWWMPGPLGASGAFASVLLAGVIGLIWREAPPGPALDQPALAAAPRERTAMPPSPSLPLPAPAARDEAPPAPGKVQRNAPSAPAAAPTPPAAAAPPQPAAPAAAKASAQVKAPALGPAPAPETAVAERLNIALPSAPPAPPALPAAEAREAAQAADAARAAMAAAAETRAPALDAAFSPATSTVTPTPPSLRWRIDGIDQGSAAPGWTRAAADEDRRLGQPSGLLRLPDARRIELLGPAGSVDRLWLTPAQLLWCPADGSGCRLSTLDSFTATALLSALPDAPTAPPSSPPAPDQAPKRDSR